MRADSFMRKETAFLDSSQICTTVSLFFNATRPAYASGHSSCCLLLSRKPWEKTSSASMTKVPRRWSRMAARRQKTVGSYGKAPEGHFATEHGHRFDIDWERGQKTGFFIDQRENRALLRSLASGKKVLNVFQLHRRIQHLCLEIWCNKKSTVWTALNVRLRYARTMSS